MSSLCGCPFCARVSIVRRSRLSLNVLSDATWSGLGQLGREIAILKLDIWSEAVRSEVVWSAAAFLGNSSARIETSSLNLEVWSGGVPSSLRGSVLFEIIQSGMTCPVRLMLTNLRWAVCAELGWLT